MSPRSSLARVCVVAVALSFAGLAALPTAAAPVVDELVPRHAFVGFRTEVTPALLGQLLDGGATSAIEVPSINAAAVVAPLAVLREVQDQPEVRGVRLQRRLTFNLYASPDLMDARTALEADSWTAAGVPFERPAVDGSGVTVAVIDTGVFPHADLGSRLVGGLNFEGPLLARDVLMMTAEEWDALAEATGDVGLVDDVGHGTHVAGTIAGDGSSASGLDLRGVAPGANILSMKIGSSHNGVVDDNGWEANAIFAMDYLARRADELGIKVANNSWSVLEAETLGLRPTDFDPVKEATLAVVEAGVTMVFAAGNDGPGPDTVNPIPNGLDEVLTVAAACKGAGDTEGSCPAGQVTSFSSRGAGVDVTAPGDEILAAMGPSVITPLGQVTRGSYFGDTPQDELVNRLSYMRLSGTSMAAPHATGVVALMLEVNPNLTPAQVETCLTSTATDLAEVLPPPEGEDAPAETLQTGFDTLSGHGMINAPAALRCAVQLAGAVSGAEPAPPAQPQADPDVDRQPLPTTGGGAAAAALLALAMSAPIAGRKLLHR